MRDIESFRRKTAIGLIVFLFSGAMLLTLNSCMTTVSERTPDATGNVSNAGGTVTVDDPSSPISGVSVEAPSGAFDSNTHIAIYSRTERLSPPAGFPEPVSPCIEIDTSSPISDEGYVILHIPVEVKDIESFKYNTHLGKISSQSLGIGNLVLQAVSSMGRSYLIHPVALLDRVATFRMHTLILNRVQVYYTAVMPSWDPKTLPAYTVTGFDPGQDRFPIPNDAEPGNCSGMTYFAAWYWENHSSSKRLVQRYGIGESMEIALEAQHLTENALPCIFWDNEQRDIYDIVEQMRQAHGPVPVFLRRETHLVEDERYAYHAVLAYSWTGTRLLCLDPNSEVTCPLAAPRPAEIYHLSDSDWAYTASNGTEYEDISKAHQAEKFSDKLNVIYEKYSDLSVEITLDDVTNDTGVSGPVYPGSYIVLNFNIRVQGHEINFLPCLFTFSLNADHSSIIALSGQGVAPHTLKVGDNHIKWSLTIPEDAPSGEYDVLIKVYSNGVCDDEILRDVTGNGPNSGVQSGMWIPAFEVISGEIEITQPASGTTWTAGTNGDLRWNKDRAGNYVKIEYSTDNGSSWSTIVESVSNSGVYKWPIPSSIDSSQCKIRISSIAFPDVTGTSPTFTIARSEDLPDITGTWISTITGEQHYERWEPPDGDKAEDVTHRIEQQEWIPFVITDAETDKVTGYLLNGAEKAPIVNGTFTGTTLQVVLHRDWGNPGSTGYKHLEFRLALDQETGILQGQGSAIVEFSLPAWRDRTTINIEDITLRRN